MLANLASFVALQPGPVKDPAAAFSHNQDPQETLAGLKCLSHRGVLSYR